MSLGAAYSTLRRSGAAASKSAKVGGSTCRVRPIIVAGQINIGLSPAKAADVRERDGLLSVAILLEALAQNIEREEAQQQPKA